MSNHDNIMHHYYTLHVCNKYLVLKTHYSL